MSGRLTSDILRPPLPHHPPLVLFWQQPLRPPALLEISAFSCYLLGCSGGGVGDRGRVAVGGGGSATWADQLRLYFLRNRSALYHQLPLPRGKGCGRKVEEGGGHHDSTAASDEPFSAVARRQTSAAAGEYGGGGVVEGGGRSSVTSHPHLSVSVAHPAPIPAHPPPLVLFGQLPLRPTALLYISAIRCSLLRERWNKVIQVAVVAVEVVVVGCWWCVE